MLKTSNNFFATAPARVCLFGDHQDYLELPVIASAINKFIRVTGTKNKTKKIHFNLLDLNDIVEIDIDDVSSKPRKGDHLRFVLYTLNKLGCNIDSGMNIKVSSDIYINAGISSSSALIVCLVDFFIKSFGFPKKVDRKLIAEIAYRCEVLEQKGSGGRMDQYTIALSNTIFLDTKLNGSFELLDVPFDNLIIANSGVKKSTDLVLSKLKNEAISILTKIKKIDKSFNVKNVSQSQLASYKNFLNKRSREILFAAVQNYKITIGAYNELKQKKPNQEFLIKKINDHHQILKNNLKITVPKIDNMILQSIKAGALGAKVIGSGGGGSILVIPEKSKEKNVIESLFNSGSVQVDKIKILKN